MSNKVKLVVVVVGVAIVGLIIYYSPQRKLNGPTDQQNQIVGGDTDEHGCLGSAGYSYCSATSKCSRAFEELCPDAVTELVKKIKDVTGLELQKTDNTEFTWNLRDGSNFGGTQISGLSFEAKNIPRLSYQKVEDYLKNTYGQDINNVADGVVSGLRGYSIGYMVCVLNFQNAQMKDNAQGLSEPVNDSLNVKFSCGYFNPNDMPKIMATQAIKSFLATKYKKDIKDVNVTIAKFDDTHVVGSVKFGADPQSEGGLVLAVKKDGDWQVVFDGNGSVDCAKLKNIYGFSDELLKPQFCD